MATLMIDTDVFIRIFRGDAALKLKIDALATDAAVNTSAYLDAVKAMFKNKEIEIVVYERDETAYLLRSPANRAHLLNAIRDIEQNQNIVTPAQEQ